MKFDVALTWEIEDGVFMPLRVRGVRQPSFSAVRSGHPDRWAPAEGGELEDMQVFSGARLPLALESRLFAEDAFIRAVEAAL